MKTVLLNVLLIYSLIAQTDTLYFDPQSGNYIVRYVGVLVDEEGNERDTLISFEFEPSTKIDPVINSYVTPTLDGKFLYRYTITNGAKAQQNLNEFSLEFGEGVSVENRTPITSWDNSRPKNFLPKTGLANRWVWYGHQGLEATWHIDSCMIASDGLPSITDSYSQAVHHIMVWPADQKDPSNIDIDLELLHLDVYPVNYVHRKTVGPKLPPRFISDIALLDTLISYKHQSRALGWIDNDGIVNSLDQKLENAKKQLQKGNTTSAKNIIQAFISEVEAQKDKHLTSEAYALLKYNAEYLVSQLGGKNK